MKVKRRGACVRTGGFRLKLSRPLLTRLAALVACALLVQGASALPLTTSATGDDEDRREVWIDPALRAVVADDPDALRVLVLGFSGIPDEAAIAHLAARGFHATAFDHVPVAAVVAAGRDVPRLMDTPGLVSVSFNKPLALMDAAPRVLPDAHMGNFGGTGDAQVRADAARALGYDGTGVGVAIVDTGVNGHHSALLPRTLGGPLAQNVKYVIGEDRIVTRAPGFPANVYVEDQVDTDTTGGHGTHVAGIAAGTWTADGTLGGRAPGATLVGFGTGETLAVLWVVAAFNWIIENKDAYDIRVTSNSWGIVGPYAPLDPVNLATKALDDAGVLVLFSAGNSGPAPRTLNAYAQAPHVLAVGATTLSGSVAAFSSRGDPYTGKPGPDVVAPGANIVAPRSAPVSSMEITLRPPVFDAAFVPVEQVPEYRALSGTSMSAPQVAGVAAQLFQANPDLTPAEARVLLMETARPLFGYGPESQGAGMVDAEAAVLAATGGEVPERDWVRPTEVAQDGDAVTVPFHGAMQGSPRKNSATVHDLPFPVRLPADALTVTVDVTLLTGAEAAPADARGIAFTLTGADGKPVLSEVIDTTAGESVTFTTTVPADVLEAHASPGWNGGYWTVTLTADAVPFAYDVTAAVTYPDGVLPPVQHTPAPPPEPLPERTAREPILIATDEDFTAENGVTGGSGTAADPYVIEGWEIDASQSYPAIQIGGPLGTTAHTVIRNVRVHDALSFCIKIENARNVRVESSHVDGCGWGVYASHRSTGVTVADNVFNVNERAIAFYGVSGAVVTGNVIRESSENGIVVSQGATQGSTVSTNILIEGNTLTGPDTDLSLLTSGTFGVEVRRNAMGGGATLELGSATHGNVVSETLWLDGQPVYEKSVLGVETPEATPLNTLVDAGSDRVPDADGRVCFTDALVESDVTGSVESVTWDFGDGTMAVGEETPCHTYAAGDVPTTARLVVTTLDATGEKRVLEDTVRVG